MVRGFNALRRRLRRALRQLGLNSGSVDHLQARFDPVWYRGQYLEGSNEAPFQHYIRTGAHLGHSPNADFDEIFYRERYPDVARSIADGYSVCGFDHYLRYGRWESRAPRADDVVEQIDLKRSYDYMRLFFDEEWYAKQYRVGIDEAFTHYLNVSRAARHNPNPQFDESFYLAFYKDVRKEVAVGRFLCGFEHYVLSGRFEDRITRHDVERTLQIRMPSLLHPVGFDQASQLAARLRPIPSVAAATRQPTVWFLVPTLNPDIFFGGYRSGLELAASLLESGRRVTFVICDDPNSDREYAMLAYRQHRLSLMLERADVINIAKTKSPLEIAAHDRILAYSAWEVYLARDLARRTSGKIGFLVQEYEPIFHPYSAEHAIVAEAYRLPHFPIFNSFALKEYFIQHSLGVFGWLDNPKRGADYAVFEHAVVRLPPPTAVELKRSTRKLVLYARPEPHAARNLFPLAWLALQQLIKRGIIDGTWRLHGIGALRDHLVEVSDGVCMQLHSKFSESEYHEFLRDVDVGVSLMYAPHPSLVPYEMAQAGARVVTNVFENRTAEYLRSISENIVPCEPNVESIAAAVASALASLDDVDSRVRGAQLRHRSLGSSWPEVFSQHFLNDGLRGWLEPESTASQAPSGSVSLIRD